MIPELRDRNAVERDRDLAFDLYDAQPTHPEIARLARRVLGSQPDRSGVKVLLAEHLGACGDVEESRRLMLEVVGKRDAFFIDAARFLRDLELQERNLADGLSWARMVVAEDQEFWHDQLVLGRAMAFTGDLAAGWARLDEAVALCSRTTPEMLGDALAAQVLALAETYAPQERFIAAAEEAVRVDPMNAFAGEMLGYAYLQQYRFDDAERYTAMRLREDPTNDLMQTIHQLTRTLQGIVAKAGTDDVTLDDIRDAGVLEVSWQETRDRNLGIDLTSAMAALEEVLPVELRETLRPPVDEADAPPGRYAKRVTRWHDGQIPGTGSSWSAGEPFRLLSAAEIVALGDAMEADPAAYPDWPENEYWEIVMTDDAGAYLAVVAFGRVVKRRPGRPDEPVAASLTDWFWDRVVACGGRDPRPAGRPA